MSTLLSEASDIKKYDVRMTERHLNRGALTPQELKKFLDALPDDTENSETVTLADLEKEGGGPSAPMNGVDTTH